MKALNKEIGRVGEDLALEHLLTKGYTLVERNFHTRFGEIDLVVHDGSVIVFVEVKTKIGRGFGSPEDMFDRHKYRRVKRMATVYLGGRDTPCRIDMVAVILNPDRSLASLTHYPNVTF